MRKRIAPQPPETTADAVPRPNRSVTYRPWAELLRRTFGVDVLDCPNCHGRMRLVAMVTEPNSVKRFLGSLGEHAAVPERAPNRAVKDSDATWSITAGIDTSRLAAALVFYTD